MIRNLAIALCLLATACTHAPIVDMQGRDQTKYAADLSECQSYAEQVQPVQETALDTLIGGVIGAAFGAAVGAAVGDPVGGTTLGASLFGGAGFFTGANDSRKRQENVVRNCLQGRGWRVLA